MLASAAMLLLFASLLILLVFVLSDRGPRRTAKLVIIFTACAVVVYLAAEKGYSRIKFGHWRTLWAETSGHRYAQGTTAHQAKSQSPVADANPKSPLLPTQASEPQISRDVKVVFLKGNTLMTANADGSNLQTLVNDGVYKTNPRWSPAGDKIVYDTPTNLGGPGENTDNLIVITAAGQTLKNIPQASGKNLYFSANETGWYGEDAVYVTGSSLGNGDRDYLTFDSNSGTMTEKLETVSPHESFQTCPIKGQVAYLNDTRSQSHVTNPSVSVEVNGSRVYTAQLPSDIETSYLLTDLYWSGDCMRLAFIETESAGKYTFNSFVVLSGATVEARIDIPDIAGQPAIVPLDSSFAVLGGPPNEQPYNTVALLYRSTTHSLAPAPTVLQQLQGREAAENQLMQRLGGSFPDWYRSSP